jgi:peptidyl-prolyl cis-trans isomerase SurA
MKFSNSTLDVLKASGWALMAAVLYLVAPGCEARAADQGEVLVNRIVAEVNDDIITLYELEQTAAPFIRHVRTLKLPLAEERQKLYEVREKMLNQLIDQKLTDQEVRRYNITVDEESVDKAIEEMKKRYLMTDQQLRAGLNEENMTMDEYREQLKNQILRMRLMNRQIKSKIVITDEDIRAFYEKNKANYGGETLYRLRQIIVSPAGGEAQAQQKMETILVKLTEGATFADLAREYSDGPMANDGGLLGEFKQKDLAPFISKALAGLKAGEHTSILKTDRGLQIFYIDEMKTLAGKSLEQMTPEIEDQLYDRIVKRKFDQWLTELRAQSHIKIIR